MRTMFLKMKDLIKWLKVIMKDLIKWLGDIVFSLANKNLIKWLDDIVFSLANVVFSIIPVAVILFGSGLATLTPLLWFFNQKVSFIGVGYVLLGILIAWMGFKWDDLIIEHYPTSIAKKENEKKT